MLAAGAKAEVDGRGAGKSVNLCLVCWGWLGMDDGIVDVDAVVCFWVGCCT